LKLKYEELIRDDSKEQTDRLLLPLHYKLLNDLQKHLDNTLNFMRMRHKQQTSEGRGIMFEDLKNSVEKTYGRQFDIGVFQQIMYVAPSFYVYSWIKKPKTYNQYSLIIDFPENYTYALS
jgi:DNA replication factor CDT1 like